ncbi:site-specific DNA-methyltransferase [Devosia enhydra]|uniref:site-specific DNA-methyltransferase n=1 Tax=Devosia enhydra TaxID=665118 RepID=UPI001FCD17E2|nr:site-specific DNA-methyltransferase [Devosia enhydra]
MSVVSEPSLRTAERRNMTLQLEHWPLERLKPYNRNARTHSVEQITSIANSLLEFGWGQLILVRRETEEIIAGHGRYYAAEQLRNKGDARFAVIPVAVKSHLSDEQAHALAIADNRLAELSDWDFDLLKSELDDLKAADFDLEVTGFSDKDLALMFDWGTEGQCDPDDLPAPEDETVTRTGDTWLLGDHVLRCGDSTSADDVAALLGGRVPAVMVTDPPYGVEYEPGWRADAGINANSRKLGEVLNDSRADWSEAWALYPGDVAYVWHAGKFASTVQDSLESCGFEVRSQIVWRKERFALGRGDYHWQHEPCWYAVRGGRPSGWLGDRTQSTVWDINAREGSGLGHGTQKPVECMKRPIENSTVLSAYIYDPFVGSGTTIIAAGMTGRRCLAMELSPHYVDIAVRRWQAFTGRQATLAGTGDDFRKVAEKRSQTGRLPDPCAC